MPGLSITSGRQWSNDVGREAARLRRRATKAGRQLARSPLLSKALPTAGERESDRQNGAGWGGAAV